METNKIEFYLFQDAPESIKELSTFGGDEDYAIVVDREYLKDNMRTLSNIFRLYDREFFEVYHYVSSYNVIIKAHG